MDFFRAVPANTDLTKRHVRLNTRRLPSNIPYAIDNLWEYLRPANKPSRRHAVYASPSPELALENASAFTPGAPDVYVACHLVFEHSPRFMQLSVTDARHHADVKALQRIIHGILGSQFADLSVQQKLDVAALFLPGVASAELEAAAQVSTQLRAILDQSAQVSTIWQGGDILDPQSKGELFFELDGDNGYSLQKI